MGTINKSVVHPREVFKNAYLSSASGIICIHNHPSGDVNPSIEDKRFTKALVDIGNVQNIPILDHIIIGDNCYIGAGATIIGGIEIGNNCRIGAGAIVVEDIPDDSLVVMAKPTIIHKENMDNRFITYIDGKKVFFNNGKWERFDE